MSLPLFYACELNLFGVFHSRRSMPSSERKLAYNDYEDSLITGQQSFSNGGHKSEDIAQDRNGPMKL